MSMSGISVDDEVTTVFNEMKLRKVHKFLICKIENKKRVLIEHRGDPKNTECVEDDEQAWNEFRQLIPDKEARYAVYDFGFRTKDAKLVKKLAFLFWSPDDGAIGSKMIYASTKESVKKSFPGIGIELQANSPDELEYESCRAEVERRAK